MVVAKGPRRFFMAGFLGAAFWLAASAAASPVIEIGPAASGIQAGTLVEILDDPEGMLTIKDVAAPEQAAQWRPSGREVPNFGFSADAYWNRLTLRNTGPAAGRFIIVFDYPLLDHVDLYAPGADGEFTVSRAGDHRPFAQRQVDYRSNAFAVDLAAGEARTLYARIKAEPRDAIFYPVRIWSASEFHGHLQRESLLLGGYYGLILVMALYNLFLLAATRDSAYFYYVLYIGLMGFVMAWMNGIGIEYLWPNAIWLQNEGAIIALNFVIVAVIQFSRVFINTPDITPRFDRYMKGLIALGLAGASMPLFLPYWCGSVTSGLVVFLSVPVIFNAAYCWRRGARHARFFLLGWTAVIAGAVMMSLRNFGLLPENFLTTWSVQIASAFEAVLFSLALADRINALRESEGRLTREKEVALAASVMKDKFVRLVSHDLKTPLSAMQGYALLTVDEVREGKRETALRHLEWMLKAMGSMTQLIDSLLRSGRFNNGSQLLRVEPFPARALAGEAAAQVQAQAESKKVALVNEIPSGLMLEGDRTLIGEVLLNLLTNAVKFTRPGGAVRMFVPEGTTTEIVVADNGVGIEPGRLGRLFEWEVKTSTAGTDGEPGSGLGLPLCREIMAAHGGRIWAESAPGEGSAFHIFLPTR